MAVPCAGEAKHAANLIDAGNIGKKSLGRPAGAIGITGEEDGFSNLAGSGADMDGHRVSAPGERKGRFDAKFGKSETNVSLICCIRMRPAMTGRLHCRATCSSGLRGFGQIS
jgi:hypothetical protein